MLPLFLSENPGGSEVGSQRSKVIIQLFHHPAIPLSRGPIFAFQAFLIFAVLCWGSIAICYEGLEWDRFRLRPEVMNRDYDQFSFEADRVDNYYNAGLKAQYTIREWVSADLSYRYRRTDTDYQFAEYTENRVELGVNFSY